MDSETKRLHRQQLATIKTLDFARYALSHGYERDAKDSTKRVTVLRREADDGKLLVKVGNGGNYIYRDERSSETGTLIDFAMRQTGMSLDEARQHLADWGNLTSISLHPVPAKPGQNQNVPVCPADDEPDRARMKAIWGKASWVPEHPYLISRQIPKTVLQDVRFHNRWRLDRYGNAVFPSWDRQGICGLEFRSAERKHFANGGKRGLWVSTNVRDCGRLMVTEAPVDALSFHALYIDQGDSELPWGYACPGGSLGERSKELLAYLFKLAGERKAEILIGFDNDQAGEEYAATIAKLAPVAVSRILPPVGKDWNDSLVAWGHGNGGEPWN